MRAAVPMTSERPERKGPERAAFDRVNGGWLLVGLAILLSIGFLFADGLLYVGEQWSDPEYSHGWLIPVVTAFVLWNRREILLLQRRDGSWLGVLVTLGAITLLLFSEMAFVRRGPFLCLVLLLWGLTLAALGRKSAWLAALPIAFLLFAFPPAGVGGRPFVDQLAADLLQARGGHARPSRDQRIP